MFDYVHYEPKYCRSTRTWLVFMSVLVGALRTDTMEVSNPRTLYKIVDDDVYETYQDCLKACDKLNEAER